MKRWRTWTTAQHLQSQARAAYLFLNISPCSECGLSWAEGYVHFDCPGPAPTPRPKEGVIRASLEHVCGPFPYLYTTAAALGTVPPCPACDAIEASL